MPPERRDRDRGRLHRSDHGSRYASLLVGKTMEENGIAPSTGSVSSPRGNAVAESPMRVIKAECARLLRREGGRARDIRDIERFCNRIRIRFALGWLSPEEFEKKQMEESRLKAA